MLLITHKILATDIRITQTFGALPNEAISRFSLALPIDNSKLNDGQSLSNALLPVSYCIAGRRLNWWEVTTKTVTELDADYWNQTPALKTPFGQNGLIPFMEVTT
jgi:hypothetical protein